MKTVKALNHIAHPMFLLIARTFDTALRLKHPMDVTQDVLPLLLLQYLDHKELILLVNIDNEGKQ
ncbi:hypothetical protein AM1BK_21640 [Neobacillus kokaensis]|uniref:Uncharacterized protein n=1 Tax=Neobacillus kokaensis TaxID=2759023 RepID=A0ABQ3NA45_9BACI|nr:hypothetical protein AM1BK_21640 [Neobacillus kokaensis]